MRKEKRGYIAVNVPRAWEMFLDEALELPIVEKMLKIHGYPKTPSSFGKWVIKEFLLENTSFRFEHFNTLGEHITLFDRKLNHTVDIHKKKTGELWCEECEKTDCVHIRFAPKVLERER